MIGCPPGVLLTLATAVVSCAVIGCSCEEAESRPMENATDKGVPTLGLIEAPDHELVVQNCVRCHGPRQFLQQRGNRETWLGLIRRMQRDHGMSPLTPDVEDRIVAYLATHYGPEHRGRRLPVPAELLPPNPYATGG